MKGEYLMIYSKANLNNFKGLELNTDISIRKVNNWSFGETFVDLDEQTIACTKRKKEQKRLLQLQKTLLEQTKHAVNISLYGYSYIEASKSKRK